MTQQPLRVKDAQALQDAVKQKVPVIEVEGKITELKTLNLSAGTRLTGVGEGAELHFGAGLPGLNLSANHQISGLRIVTDEALIALGLADDAPDLGTLDLHDLTLVGRFHLEAAQAQAGTLNLKNIHVEKADARLAAHRPAGFGVEVLIGVFSVYNFSKKKDSQWTLSAENISGGSKDSPLRGSGVFVFGGNSIPVDADLSQAPAPTAPGGQIEVTRLSTGELHTDGGIPQGASNLITGGVFLGSGAHARSVVNAGPVSTYGPNDMVLDNWGRVDEWVAQAAVTSAGASGIGFVNFGDIDVLRVQAPITTIGLGARGFNLYDGSLKEGEFQSITTHGDGAIGMQLSKPFGKITVQGDIRTAGSEGDSLVHGKITHLKAHALSLKKGAQGDSLIVKGEVEAQGQDIPSLDFEAPASVVKALEIGGKTVK